MWLRRNTGSRWSYKLSKSLLPSHRGELSTDLHSPLRLLSNTTRSHGGACHLSLLPPAARVEQTQHGAAGWPRSCSDCSSVVSEVDTAYASRLDNSQKEAWRVHFVETRPCKHSILAYDFDSCVCKPPDSNSRRTSLDAKTNAVQCLPASPKRPLRAHTQRPSTPPQ